MAPPAKKRRTDPAEGTGAQYKKQRRHNGADKPSQAVSLDQLAWKEVPMPDRLEDVEGFYGLEEVEDVEVVRGDAGIYEYRVRVQNCQGRGLTNSSRESKRQCPPRRP